jgi:hypothetical protein
MGSRTIFVCILLLKVVSQEDVMNLLRANKPTPSIVSYLALYVLD